jgi:transposase
MSKRRAVVLAVVVEGLTQVEAARRYGLSEATVSRWVARWRDEGDAAFEPRSRRPRSSPNRVPTEVVERIVNLRVELTGAGLDAGPATIAWHLERHHDVVVSTSTIRRRLLGAGLIIPEPKTRPKTSYLRFEAAVPNECWQSDFTHWALAEGSGCEILTWLDDHARYALSVTAHRAVTGPTVAETFGKAAGHNGYPASVLTDNAMVYTTRFAGGRGGRRPTRDHPRRPRDHPETLPSQPPHHLRQGRAVPADPQALARRPTPRQDPLRAPRPTRRLRRALQQPPPPPLPGPTHPHRRLRPATQASPHGLGAGTHHPVRHDRIDKTGAISLRRAGRLHHIGIGRTHAGRTVLVLIDDLDIRVIDTTTGQILRHLTLDPTRGYQPRFK